MHFPEDTVPLLGGARGGFYNKDFTSVDIYLVLDFYPPLTPPEEGN